MSLKQIEIEIQRFLSTTAPEVLCIKGHWGVGKTYGWKKFLSEAKAAQAVGLDRYSYVSLFGLNSLDDLRFSVFENTVTGERIGSSPDASSFGELVGKGGDLARRMRPLVEAVGSVVNRKGLADVLFRSAFLAVKQQIICLDDIERAGNGLRARDVLGLASFLKEERCCKVVLLLNDKEHDEKNEFDRQLEKVADVTLVFDLTPEEAAEIALTAKDRATVLVKPNVTALGITNIRVIKKIERLASRLAAILDGIDDAILEKKIAVLTLASWSVQQPNEAPPLNFLKGYNFFRTAMRAGREEVDADTLRFSAQIKDYPFKGPEDFDLLVMDGAANGFFQETEIRQKAEELQQEWQKRSSNSKFSGVWHQLYHGSLATEDDAFLDALYESAIDEAASISPLNINSSIRMLRELGRPEQADAVIASYVVAHEVDGPDFFDIGRHHFSQEDRLDEGLRGAFALKRQGFIDTRDPLTVLTAIGERSNWTTADVALMAKQSADDFERMFETLEGNALRPSIEMILAIGNGHAEGSAAIRTASVEALRRIAAKSPLRARKVASYGIHLDKPDDDAVTP